jgi:predicted O-linked N-acetylglucosamine transferase (SPINDLY family)
MNRKQRRAAASGGPTGSGPAGPGGGPVDRALELAVQHLQAGRAALAEAPLREVLAAVPRHADAQAMLGSVQQTLGRTDEAIASYRAALAVNPRFPAVLCNLGNLLQATGRLDESVDSYRRALTLVPGDATVHSNLGSALKALGKLDDAAASFAQALALRPDLIEARLNLANLWLVQKKFDEAGAAYRAIAAQRPDLPGVFSNLGMVLRTQGKMAEALDAYQRSLAINAADPAAHANLGNVLADLGRLDEAHASYQRALALKPDYADVRSSVLMLLNYDPAQTPETLLAAHRDYARALPPQPAPAPHANTRDPERLLRIGYVSADFCAHPVGYFVLPVLAAHDRARVSVHCYSGRLVEDDVSAQLRGHAAVWRSTVGVDDAGLDAQIRADGIDILIDLAGHTAGNRLTAFARQPAPVQITWLGYPATTGVSAIGHRLTDAFADPAPDADAQGTEALVRLPGGFHCYVPTERAPDTVPSPSLTTGRVTFGSFNNLSKVNDAVIDVWGRVIAAVPDSRLLVKARPLADPDTRARYQARFAAAGIPAERLSLIATAESWRDHMAQYGQVDVALDPFPYNGTTTTCDALWMGVPVIALRGDRHAGRVGVSLLSHVGLPELIADTLDDYVAKAAALAQALDRRAALRGDLRQRLAASSIGDPQRFTRTLEDAYRDLWRRWCGA